MTHAPSEFRPVIGTNFTAEQILNMNRMMDIATHNYRMSQPALQTRIIETEKTKQMGRSYPPSRPCMVCDMPTRLSDPMGEPVCSACQ